jgi:two-component system phosphate regulon sensor histidine kinase PhoR
VWNELKQNLSSARVYLKEFLFFNTFIAVIIIAVVDNSSLSIPLILLIILSSIVYLNFIGSKRNKELDEIKTIISNIRKNEYSDSSAIKLSSYLAALQEEIKLMFEKTRSDIEYLKKLERMRTEFLANVSHELRTPIFAIQGYIETLLNGAINDPKVNNSFLEKANLHTINLSNLLNDLIDISMIESGEMRMSFRYFNLNEYLEPLVKELGIMAEEKNLELIYHPVKTGQLVFGDKNKLRQVFVNLVQNAIKYTEQGKIEILAEEESKHVSIIIRDTGIGIPEEDLARIFERFYRVDKARSRAVGGTGLGLAIVKHIVEAHGSRIEVKSKLDSGSEFSFKLKK